MKLACSGLDRIEYLDLASPTVLAVLPGLEGHLAHAVSHADILGCSVVLKRSPEECPAAEASCGSIVDVAGSRLSTNLKC